MIRFHVSPEHAWASQKARNDMHGVIGCDAGRQREKPRRNQAAVIVLPNGDLMEWCVNTAVQQQLDRVVGRRQSS